MIATAAGIIETLAGLKAAGARGVPLRNDSGMLVPVGYGDLGDPSAIALLARWRDQAADAYRARSPVTAEGTANWLRRGVLGTPDRVLFWVTEPSGRRVGHLGLFRHDPGTRSIELDNVVRGEADGAPGIMTLATEALCQWCLRRDDIDLVCLRVFSDNHRALKLYARAGFVETMRRPLVRHETADGWKWEEAPELYREPVQRHFVTMRLTKSAARGPVFSIVMPARNEEGNLPRAHAELTRAMEALGEPYEVLLVDNASTDGTGKLAEGICARDARWRYLRFSRDFGVETSMLAGLRAARGDATVVLFSDLQDPPELIGEMAARWREGFDVVYGVVNRRGGEPWWKALGARLFYRIMRAAGETPLPADATDFRLLSRRAREAVAACGERNRYFRGLSHWVGYPSSAFRYDRRPRTAGKSKAPPFYMMALAARALTAFSLAPVHLLGLAAMAAFLVATGCTALWAFGPGTGPIGISGPVALQWWTLASVLAAGWTCGEYAGRTYRESRQRPEYLVEHAIRWDNAGEAGGRMTVETAAPAPVRFSGYHTPRDPSPAINLPGRQRPAWAPPTRC
jgi:dolichol-phosphate mannosyltransferase